MGLLANLPVGLAPVSVSYLLQLPPPLIVSDLIAGPGTQRVLHLLCCRRPWLRTNILSAGAGGSIPRGVRAHVYFCLDLSNTASRWLFFLMSIFGIRIWLARLIPRSLTLAVGAGIGLFICKLRGCILRHVKQTHKRSPPSSPDWLVRQRARRRGRRLFKPARAGRMSATM